MTRWLHVIVKVSLFEIGFVTISSTWPIIQEVLIFIRFDLGSLTVISFRGRASISTTDIDISRLMSMLL